MKNMFFNGRFGWILLLVFGVLVISTGGCKRTRGYKSANLKILTSFLPIYIFTANIVNGVDGVSVDVLLPPEGAGPHGYHLTPTDIKKIEEANVIVINGFGLESFLEDKLKNINPKIKIIVASEGITSLPDSFAGEGYHGEEEEEGETHEKEHEHGVWNPHVWVDPWLAAEEVKTISAKLGEIDKRNAHRYFQNSEGYREKLLQLGESMKKASFEFVNGKIVTVHNAFEYMAKEMGLKVIAVLRVEPTAEPSPAELARIEEIIKKEKPAGIFTEPQFPDKLAKSLAEQLGVKIFVLDPVATIASSAKWPVPLDYYERVMYANLSALQEAMRDN